MEIIERDGIWTKARKEISGKIYDIKIETTERTTAVCITRNGKHVHNTGVELAVFKDVCDMERQDLDAEFCEGPNRMLKIIRHDGAWTTAKARFEGKLYEVHIKHFEVPSPFGIKNGRISKLWVREETQDTPCIIYEHDWETQPRSKAAKAIYEEILAAYN